MDMEYAEPWRLSDSLPFEQQHQHHQHQSLDSLDPEHYSYSAIPSPSPAIPSPAIPRRTNSLALEKADCHVCVQNQRKCDRQRRECRTCESFGDTCRGYPVRLQWQDNSTSSTRNLNSYAPAPPPQVGTESAARTASFSSTTRPFKFVGSKPRKPRKPRKPKALHFGGPEIQSKRPRNEDVDVDRAATAVNSPRREPHVRDQEQGQIFEDDLYDATIHDSEPLMAISEAAGNLGSHDPITWTALDLPMSSNQSLDLHDVFNFMGIPNELQEIPNFEGYARAPFTSQFDLDTIDEQTEQTRTQRPRDEENEGDRERSTSTQSPPDNAKDPQNEQSFPKNVSEQSTAIQIRPNNAQLMKPPLSAFPLSHDRFSGLLNMYDRVFCIYPVTGDMDANPFRCTIDTSYGSLYLLHAILALSIHHLSRQIGDTRMNTEVAGHKDTALQLYVNALQSPQLHSLGLTLLDTAVILFALNATNSAFGNWNQQLKRVLGLLEMFGGTEALRHSSRVRAQVAMFLWWDTTLSLLSRKSRIIPSRYFTALCTYSEQDPWNFFDLVGCPSPLVGCLIELSDLVAEYEKTREMRWSKFDPSRVIAIQQFLQGWSDLRFADVEGDDEDEEAMEHKRDCYHCTEAWRNALLIYILRIFKHDDLPRSPHAMSYRARVTLDHVRCCRKTTNVQKQLLFPVFLAACEASSPDARVWAKEYCTWWNDKSAYGMFSSVVSLIEIIWARQLIEGKDNLWWGQVIDDKCSSTVQCLLG